MLIFCALGVLSVLARGAEPPEIRTPAASAAPRINGPSIFGVRPGSPFLYRIPASGDRPIQFYAEGLPSGLKVDSKTGELTCSLSKTGEHLLTLHAKNRKGTHAKKLRIVVGEQISLTPPMGWKSWNCWGSHVTAEKVLQSARGMVSSGHINHGWTYINIDDAWQGQRGGGFNAIQGNEKFPDLKLAGKLSVRDLWRQKGLGQFDSQFELPVASHGAELVKVSKGAK